MNRIATSLALAVGLFLLAVPAAKGDRPATDFAGKQIELCMIGDSITWATNGDYWRKELLKHMPELAFIGTHTARFGYSHAGEGGNSTGRVLERINRKSSIPDARYYHLLIGVNDSAAAKSAENAPAVAARTRDSIVKIVNTLLERPTTEKVFLGTIMPCSPDNDPGSDAMQFRDLAGSQTNTLLRDNFKELFPSGKVVLVEYEKPLRARDDRRQIIRLHPTPAGYAVIAPILTEVLKRETAPPADPKAAKYGVEVTNLYSNRADYSAPLIPGWYVLSCRVDEVEGDEIALELDAKNPRTLRFPFHKEFRARAKAGDRVEFEFETGYQGYGYDQCSTILSAKNGKVSCVLLEKMRPGRKASAWREGRSWIDAESPMHLGEKLLPAP